MLIGIGIRYLLLSFRKCFISHKFVSLTEGFETKDPLGQISSAKGTEVKLLKIRHKNIA